MSETNLMTSIYDTREATLAQLINPNARRVVLAHACVSYVGTARLGIATASSDVDVMIAFDPSFDYVGAGFELQPDGTHYLQCDEREAILAVPFSWFLTIEQSYRDAIAKYTIDQLLAVRAFWATSGLPAWVDGHSVEPGWKGRFYRAVGVVLTGDLSGQYVTEG